MSFRSGRLVVEELQNIWATKLSSLTVLGIGLAMGLLAPTLSCVDSLRIMELNDRFVEAGVNVLVVTRNENLPLPAQRCEALNRLTGVIAAGGIDTARVLYLSSRPGQPISFLYGTRHASNLIWSNDPESALAGASIVVGSELGRSYGLRPGYLAGIVSTTVPRDTTQTVRVDHVARSTVRTTTADTTMFVVRPSETVSRCLVEVTPQAADYFASILTGWWDPIEDVVISAHFIDTSRAYAPLSTQLENRASRWAPMAALATLALISIGYVRSRKWDFATYRRLGLTLKGVVVFALIDTGVLILLPVLIGASLWLAFLAPVDIAGTAGRLATLDLAMLVVSLPLIAPILTAVIARTNPTDVFAER